GELAGVGGPDGSVPMPMGQRRADAAANPLSPGVDARGALGRIARAGLPPVRAQATGHRPLAAQAAAWGGRSADPILGPGRSARPEVFLATVHRRRAVGSAVRRDRRTSSFAGSYSAAGRGALAARGSLPLLRQCRSLVTGAASMPAIGPARQRPDTFIWLA